MFAEGEEQDLRAQIDSHMQSLLVYSKLKEHWSLYLEAWVLSPLIPEDVPKDYIFTRKKKAKKIWKRNKRQQFKGNFFFQIWRAYLCCLYITCQKSSCITCIYLQTERIERNYQNSLRVITKVRPPRISLS